MAREEALDKRKTAEKFGRSPLHAEFANPSAVSPADIQANIRRYGWQALLVRLVAVTLVTVYMMVSHAWLGNSAIKTPASFRILPLVILFILWMQDGHLKYLQSQYVNIFSDYEKGTVDDLVVKIDDKINVATLWSRSVKIPYLVLSFFIVFANLGF